jgi:gliding motility-associated protein GldE
MEEPPSELNYIFIQILNPALSAGDFFSVFLNLLTILLLIFLSAIFSGSENAFFSLTQLQYEELTEEENSASRAIQYLHSSPKKLLATILIANTFVNIAVVMVTTGLFSILFDFGSNPLFGFLLEVVFVTFMLVLLGEVIPKIYAFQNNVKVTKFVAVPMYTMYKVFQPLVYVLESTTAIIDKRVTKRGHVLSVDELTHAIDITSEKDAPKQEKSILKGIVNFGNTTVKQIMRQRPDVLAVDENMSFKQLMVTIIDAGYSRVPVFQNNLDHIKGILFTKDLLPLLYEEDFDWKTLIRPAFLVPESKKIDDLLKEFQSKRMHLAIVVDEFGGTSGLLTMEDILEEVFGEIHDEFDEDEHIYSKLNENTYVFEAKMLINDVCRYMEIDPEEFEEIRKESDTLGGMLLELNGDIPNLGQEIVFEKFTFKIEAVDNRRIKRIKVTIDQISSESNEN